MSTPLIRFLANPSMRLAPRGRMQLCEALTVSDCVSMPHQWTVPIGFVTDGATIPPWAWMFIGNPFSGKLLRPAILHDYLCDQPQLSSADCAVRFREGLRCEGVGTFRRTVMYWAVRYLWKQWEAKV